MIRLQVGILLLTAVTLIQFAVGDTFEIIKDSTLCGRIKCHVSPNQKFKYQEKTYYQYRYQIDVNTKVGSQNQYLNNESRLHIDANVILRFLSPCEGSLRFSNVSINHNREAYLPDFPDRAGAEFKLHLEKYMLHFAFDDGTLRDLCPTTGDPIWALNLRRGVLSMLQNTMSRFDVDHRRVELDINGICDTSYQLHATQRTSLIIHKSKNLASCRHSSKHLSFIQSQRYRSPLLQIYALHQPLLISSSECEIMIDHNIYQHIQCTSKYRLRLLANGKNGGAKTEVNSSLELIGEFLNSPPNIDNIPEEQEGPIHTKRTTLLFDHKKSQRTIYGDLRTSRDQLKAMCLLGSPQELRENFSEVFTKFVHSARLLDYQGLSQIYNRAQSICRIGRKHVINALPYIGSNAAVNVMKDLIMKGYVNMTTVRFWVLAFTLIPSPDRQTIYALAPLLDFQSQISESQFTLSYSAVIHSYCSKQGHFCATFEPVIFFMKFLENNIQNGCTPRPQTRSDIKKILESLKAIGNTGIETDTLVLKLQKCIIDESGFIPMDVKVAAIEAHRRLPSCEKSRDSFFLNYYRNISVQTELRIASYLQVMRCPDYNVIKIIRRSLEEEEINQVGSFVWSHLKNLLSSSSPSRIEIQSLLSDRDLGDKFNSDLRKFSRNYENSFFSEEYNLGANYQVNLIFSTKSYIPRSASFNLTFDLFGESINFIEINVRAEGIEFYTENFFGPNGPFSGVKITDHIHQFLRQFRSVNSRSTENKYWEDVRKLPNVIDNDFSNPWISIGYKIFGNEIKFTMLNNDKEIRTSLATLNPWDKIQQILSGKEIVHYENTIMFLDSSFVVPSMSGLPLRLDIAGTAACNIKVTGKLESKKLMSDGELKINGSITPSVNIDISGTMMLDAFYKSVGIKLKSSIYSIGATETELKIKNLKLARLSWKIPNQNMEIFSLTTNILFVKTNGAEYNEQPIMILLPTNADINTTNINGSIKVIKNTTCTWSALDQLIGLKICADYQFPDVTKDVNASYFLLNGPTFFKLSLIKADPTAESYLLEYIWKRTENESTIRLAFDTPGSQMQREISAAVSFDALNKNVTLLLKSKGNSLIALGTYIRTDDRTCIDIGLDSNETKYLDVHIGYSRKKAKHIHIYSPELFIAINNEIIVNLSGIIRSQDKNNTSQYDIDLRLGIKNLVCHLFGYMLRTNISISGNIKTEYKFQEKYKNEILQTEFSLINRSTKTLTYKAVDIKLHSTAYSQLNIVAGVRYQHALGHVELHIEVNTSPHLHNTEKHKLTAQFVATYSKPYFQTDGANISVYVAITKPIQDIDIKIGVNYHSIGFQSKTRFLIRYALGKEITLIVDVMIPRGTLLTMEGRANLTIPNFNSMLIRAKVMERSRNEYELDFAGTWFSGHNISVHGMYYDRSTIASTNHNFKIVLQSRSFTEDIILDCKLYHDITNLMIHLFIEQTDGNKNAIIFNHTVISPSHIQVSMQVEYKNSTYSLYFNVNLQREGLLKLHLDRWRDIHIAVIGVDQKITKEYGIGVKWDASRNPKSKFIMNMQLNRLISMDGEKNVSVVMYSIYPCHRLTASISYALKKQNNYMVETCLEWNVNKMIKLTIDTDYDLKNYIKILKLESELSTPFENWRKTSLNVKYQQSELDLIASGSVYWQDSQHIIFESISSIKSDSSNNEWNFNCGLLSTIHTIQFIRANLSHTHIYNKSMNSRIIIRYYPSKFIDARNIWFMENGNEHSLNITGNLHFMSQLSDFRKSELKYYLSSKSNWKFYGAANLDLNKKNYAGHLIGDLTKIKESMVQINLTTPFEKYAYVRGRFGLSEENKHIVAEITSPAGPLGIEGICQLFTKNYDFHMKLLLATPLDILQQVFVIAKLNKQEADFRMAYNNLTAGFQGVWFFNNISNFHYSYIFYTPLHGFHKIGAVAKLILIRKESLNLMIVDTEFSIHVVELKAGIKVHIRPKSPPIIAIPSKSDFNLYKKNLMLDLHHNTEDTENNVYWKAEMKIDTVIVSTILVTLDFDREGSMDKFFGYLEIPFGTIRVEDNLYFEDFFNIKNDLSIDTPFDWASEIISISSLTIDMETMTYLLDMTLNVKSCLQWIMSGLNVNYTYQGFDEGDPQLHSLKFNLKTPISFLEFMNSKTTIEVDENSHKVNVSVRFAESLVDLIGSIEQDVNYLDVSVQTRINSSIFNIPRTKITGRKDFTDREKHIELSFAIEEPELKLSKFEVSWMTENQSTIKGLLKLNTWLEPLINIEVAVFYNNLLGFNNEMIIQAHFIHHMNQNYRINSHLKDEKLEVDITTPSHPEHLIFIGNFTKINNKIYRISGHLRNIKTSEVFSLISLIKIGNDSLLSVNVIMDQKETTKVSIKPIKLRLKKEKYDLTFEGEYQQMNGRITMNLINLFNWDVQAKLDQEENFSYNLIMFMNAENDGNTTLYLQAETPWKDIEKLIFNINLLLRRETGNLCLNYQLNRNLGYFSLLWHLHYFSDMFVHIIARCEKDEIYKKNISAIVFYINPREALKHIDMGFEINIDQDKWNFGTNASVGLQNQNNIDILLTITLPPPNQDTYHFLLCYHSKNDHRDLSYTIGYSADIAKSNYASDGSLKMEFNNINGNLRLTWGLNQDEVFNNIFNTSFNSKTINFTYSVFTPKYLEEETFVLFVNYDTKLDQYSLINTNLYYPSKNSVGSVYLIYQSLSNINGTLIASTPLPNFQEVRCKFTILTNLRLNKRFTQCFWQNSSALLNSEYSYNSEQLESNLDGHIRIEFPLNTYHIGLFSYGYKNWPLLTTGYSELMYNGEKIIKGLFNSKRESKVGFEKNCIKITVENNFRPIGIIYVNQYEYSSGNEGTNYPSVKHKKLNIYQINNASAFNVSGTLKIRNTHTGQEVQLTAQHFNRTVELRTDYDILPGEFDQNTYFSLAQDAWISYHVNIVNKTTPEIENQCIVLSFVYPKRNFTLSSSYFITNSILNSKVNLIWNNHSQIPKTLGATFDWINSTYESKMIQQIAILSIKHPSFKKDVKITGKLVRRDIRDLLYINLTVDYSIFKEKLLVFSAVLLDENYLTVEKKYTYSIISKHPKTQLNLDISGYFKKNKFIIIETVSNALYKRSFLPEETGLLLGRVDLIKNEVEFSRINNEHIKYLQARYYSQYSSHIINGSLINGKKLNATGAFFISLQDKLMWMMVNYTPDAMESLRMYGIIPDARNAELNILRYYDHDLIISDISFYLRLNHSRLMTSELKWRPDLKLDIINFVKTTLTNAYAELNKDINYWRHYLQSETLSIISDVWADAQDELDEFLQDLNELKMINNDFDDLKIYLNNSYNANDFYIKDIIIMGVYMIDELSLRSHIESLPNIINEIWEIMGESGKAVRDSLLWIIETLKNIYRKISEIISTILRGDSINQISTIVEKFIIKYDVFIKDLHVTLSIYIEYIYDKVYQSISLQWYRFLMHVEPFFIRLTHYLETVGWKAVQEFLDFLYDRKIELIRSPYYDHFSNFTQDLDKFYRDIKANDIITNIQKYLSAILRFIKERYFAFVPFGKELKHVVDEIISELKDLQKLPSVKYFAEKLQQACDKVVYLYEFFEIRYKLENSIKFIHSKLLDISQTALQAESKYREAKTKFIYNPQNGLICLEQKLPISWHAFNQTPEFQEIPEYRAIIDMGSYFAVSNTTFWTLYYQIKPLTEPSNWLPPFKAQALIIGPQHFRTFDGLHYEFTGTCTYLVARDFVQNTFAILIKYDRHIQNSQPTYKIIVLIGNSAIQLDVFQNNVNLLESGTSLQLPIELENGTVFIYQNDNIVTVERENKQFKIECNFKYDTCSLELSGWYYGKIAGLLGTMNNERFDDMLASNGRIENNINKFVHSWSLEYSVNCSSNDNFAIVYTSDNIINHKFCNELFTNKSSEFSSCFSVVDPVAYKTMCTNSLSDHEACAIAMGYLQTCMFHDTYLRIPDKCTSCAINELDGYVVPEGDFRKLEGESVPRSTDIIFIIEAKKCNLGIRLNSSIEILLSHINKELHDNRLIDNRWSLVIFGGDGVYNKPRSLILNNQIFTQNISRFVEYFDHIPTGDGSQDIFEAIRFAAQLVFRAGVSKTFVLIPCSRCESEKLTLDYSVLYNALQEHGITLHILMDGDFQFEKGRLNKIFYGLDAQYSYTKKDLRILSGDRELRRQVKLSRNALGYCAPLALETNGTIFSSSKLRFAHNKLSTIKKFASVFAKRLALTAQPNLCQLCECIANNDGLTKMECAPCDYPMPISVDFVSETFNEDDITALQPIDIDYNQTDGEEN